MSVASAGGRHELSLGCGRWGRGGLGLHGQQTLGDTGSRGRLCLGGRRRGALLHGLDERLREETGLVVVCAEDPTRVVARGAAAFLAPGAARLGSGLTSLDAR